MEEIKVIAVMNEAMIELLKEKGKTKYWLIKNMEGSYQSISHMMNNETTGIRKYKNI